LRQALQGISKQAWRWVQQSLFSSDENVAAGTGALAVEPPPKPSLNPSLNLSSKPSPDPSVWAQVIAGHAKPIRLVFSARALNTWSLTWRTSEGLTLRLPQSLREPPPDIARALVAWAYLVMRKPRQAEERLAAKRERKTLETSIRAHLDGLAQKDERLVHRQIRRSRRQLAKLNPQGQYHDLRQIFAAVNAEYFENKLQAEITWSHRLGGLSTHCEKKHPDGGNFHLITISRGYDSPDVTPEILGGVVYHECLHIVYPPERREGRRIVHGRAFKQAEKQYRHYAIWMHWHRHGLPKALRRLGVR
jgi:hypothetical protein